MQRRAPEVEVEAGRMNTPGGGLALFGLYLWVTIAVGPWWVGVSLLAFGTVVNYVLGYREDPFRDG